MISVEMANLELFLSELLGAVLRMNLYLSQILYLTPRAAIGRLAILENIVEAAMKPTEGRKQIESLVGRAKEVIGKRHNIIHDTWGVRQEHKGVHRIALPMISKPKPVPIQTLKGPSSVHSQTLR